MTQTLVSQIVVPSDRVLALGDAAATNVTLTVLAGGPVFYADFLQVSSTQNLGSVTLGNSQLFEEQTWTIAAAGSPATCSVLYLNGTGTAVIVIPYAPTITPPLGPGATIIDVGQLTGAITVNQPIAANPQDGQTIRFRFSQDNSGHAITFSGAYSFGSDVTSALMPTAANSNFEILFSYHVNTGLYRALAITRGF